MSVIIIDEDCTITNLIVPGTGGCQSHGQQKVSVMTSASVCCNTSFSLSLCDTDLLYLPRELRSSSISAWCCSSKVSIDFGWILGDIPSPMPMSWNWNITLCNVWWPHYYWPGGLSRYWPWPGSGPRSVPDSHHLPAPEASEDCSQDSSPGQPEHRRS